MTVVVAVGLTLALISVSLLADVVQLTTQMVDLVLQHAILRFEVVALLHAFAAAVLRVAAIFQRAPFLFEADDFVARCAVKAFVEVAHGQRNQVLFLDHFVEGIATPVLDDGL